MAHLEVKIAVKRAEVLHCQYLIAEAYNKHYDIFFSSDAVNLNARIEPYPDRYVMGMLDGELVATAGLYLRDTYAERYGEVTNSEIERLLVQAGASKKYSARRKREYTKIVIRPDWQGCGIGRQFFKMTHVRTFLQLDAEGSCVVVACAKVSIFRGLHDALGIRTRLIKPFPHYQVHTLYRTEDDPMETRLVIPDLDIPPEVYDQPLPSACEFTPKKRATS
jgi:GNAT superfamily N-acetyltransferase